MRGRTALLVAIGVLGWAILSIAAEEPDTAVRIDALRFSFTKNVAYCRECLDSKDFKSLAQTADGLKYLNYLLRGKSVDEAWQTAAEDLHVALDDLRATARSGNPELVKTSLEKTERAWAAFGKLEPTGKLQGVPSGSNLRELMLLLDNLRGQAKVALLTGQAQEAKQVAFVLAELGPLVSNARTGDDWEILSHDFTQASLAAATSPEEDAAKLKPLFRAMSQACDDCHDSR